MPQPPPYHTLLIYENDDEFVDIASSYLSSAGTAGELGFAIVTRRKWSMLTQTLPDPGQVEFLERRDVYRRPLTTLAFYDELVLRREHEGAAVVRIVADMPVWRRPAQNAGWIGYEAILNQVFAGRPVTMLCAYDLRAQPESMLAGARQTHPSCIAGAWEDNQLYRDPRAVVEALAPPSRTLEGLRELSLAGDARSTAEILAALLEPRSAARTNRSAGDS